MNSGLLIKYHHPRGISHKGMTLLVINRTFLPFSKLFSSDCPLYEDSVAGQLKLRSRLNVSIFELRLAALTLFNRFDIFQNKWLKLSFLGCNSLTHPGCGARWHLKPDKYKYQSPS